MRQGFQMTESISFSESAQAHDKQNASAHGGGAAASQLAKEKYVWGYENAPVGGINTRPGSTVSNDLSPSRRVISRSLYRIDVLTAASATPPARIWYFQFAPGIYKGKQAMVNQGLDYYHCKGCLRCVDVCPTNALVKALEKDYPKKPWFLPQPGPAAGIRLLIRKPAPIPILPAILISMKNVSTEVSYNE